jgi:hypothetical protein
MVLGHNSSWLVIGAGTLFAIGCSRLLLDARSVTEVGLGLVIGTVSLALFLHQHKHPIRRCGCCWLLPACYCQYSMAGTYTQNNSCGGSAGISKSHCGLCQQCRECAELTLIYYQELSPRLKHCCPDSG